MIYYFRKRKNFNRIKKLIKTNPVRLEGAFGLYPHKTINEYYCHKTINEYYCENIILKFTCSMYHHRNYAEEYEVFETLQSGFKEIDLNYKQIKILYELAETKHQKPYWIKS
jgi:hypothetical protein